MGVTVATTRVACNTSTGDQTITTTDLGGLTPKAAIFAVSRGETDGTSATHAAFSIGATNGTNHAVSSGQSEDNVTGGTDADRAGTTDEVILLMALNGSVEGEANFKNWTTNGVVITWGNDVANAYLLTVTFFAGTDVSADVGTHNLQYDATSSITGLSYEPDVIFTFGHGNTFGDARSNDMNIQLGMGYNGTSIVQGTTSHFCDHSAGTTGIGEMITNNRINSSLTDIAISRDFKINTFDSGGVTFSDRQSGSGNYDNWIAYLTLNFNDAVDLWLGWVDTATSTGSQSITDPGFEPQAVITLPSHLDTINTYANSSTGSIGIGAFDADDEYMTMIYDQAGQSDSDTGNISDDKALHILDHTGSSDIIAAFTSFDTNGWTWNYSAVNGTAQKVLCLAIGTGEPPYEEPTVPDGGFDMRVLTATCQTTTGLQTITIPDWGRTPEAGIFFLTTSTGDASGSHAMLSVSAACGLNGTTADQWTCGHSSQHNVGTSNGYRWNYGVSFMLGHTTSSTEVCEADFEGFVTGGFMLDWDNAPPAGYEIQAILFAGLENVSEGQIDAPAVGSDVTITTGHRNDIVFVSSALMASQSGSAISYDFTFGACSSLGDSITQMCTEYWYRDGRATGESYAVFDDDAVARAGNSATTNYYVLTLDAFTSTSFDANATGATSQTGDDLFYLSIQLPDGVAAKVASFQSPTSTGNQDIDLGFKPLGALLGSTHLTSVGTIATTGLAAEVAGFGGFTADTEGCVSTYSRDGNETIYAYSYSGSVAIDLYSEYGHEIVAEFYSMNDDGCTLNWTTVDGSNQTYHWGLFVGEQKNPYDHFESYDSGDSLSSVSSLWSSGGNDLTIASNSGDLVVQPNTSSARSYLKYEAYTPYVDQWAQLTIDDSVNGTFIGPAVRMTGTTCYTLMADADSIYLYRIDSGTPTTLDSSTGLTIVDGDRLLLEVSGTGATVSLSCYLNDELITDIGTAGVYGDTNASRITDANNLGIVGENNGVTYGDKFIGGDLDLPTDDFVVAIAEFTTPTSTGSFDITTPNLGGLKPKGVLFFTSGATAVDTIYADARYSIGAASSSGEQWENAFWSNDNDLDPDSAAMGNSLGCINIMSSPGTKVAYARFERFIPNGCTVNFSTATTASYGFAMFFAGTEVQARAGCTSGPLVSGTYDVDTVGFQPNAVMLSDLRSKNHRGTTSEQYSAWGWALDRATDQLCSNSIRRAVAFGSSDNLVGAYDATYTTITVLSAVERAYSVGGWDSDGFTLTHESGTVDGNAYVTFFFALDTGTYDIQMDTITVPTSTSSSESYTDLDFEPQALLIIPFRRTSINVATEGDPFSSLWAIGATDGTDDLAWSTTDKHGAPTSICKTRYDRLACNITDSDGTPGHEASLVSLDSSGFTLNHSVVTGTADKWIVMGFEGPPTTGVSNLMILGVGD